MICFATAAWLAIKGERQEFPLMLFLGFGAFELFVELAALAMVLETVYV